MTNIDHYRIMCNESKTRMMTLHDTWERISNNPAVPEQAECFMKSVLGKTQLLIKKNFPFFDSFLTNIEEQRELNVNNNDLDGLWDNINIEITDLDAKYKELEVLKANNWQRPAVVSKSPRKATPKKTQTGVVKSTATASTDTNTKQTTPNRPKSSFTKSSPKPTVPNRPKSSVPRVANTGAVPRRTYTLAMPSEMASSSTAVSSPRPEASSVMPRKAPAKNQTGDSTETMTRQSISNVDEDVQASHSDEYFDALSSLSLND